MKVESLGEFGLIERIRKKTVHGYDVIAGIGDDTAVLRIGAKSDEQLLTVDNVVEGIHYKKGTEAELIGRKALARSLSDIAAMGGTPKYALITLGIPPKTEVKEIDAIYKGFFKLAKEHDVELIGGDMTRSPKALFVSVVVIGKMKGRRAVLRKGARCGDFIFVTGALGGSLMGRHLRFQPRVKEGQWLSEKKIPSSMIDISDGLAADLKHILDENKVGACLDQAMVPVSKEAMKLSHGKKSVAFQRAIGDGEDYELLFTTSLNPGLWVREFECRFKIALTCIGKIIKGSPRIYFEDKKGKKREFKIKGFAHF